MGINIYSCWLMVRDSHVKRRAERNSQYSVEEKRYTNLMCNGYGIDYKDARRFYFEISSLEELIFINNEMEKHLKNKAIVYE